MLIRVVIVGLVFLVTSCQHETGLVCAGTEDMAPTDSSLTVDGAAIAGPVTWALWTNVLRISWPEQVVIVDIFTDADQTPISQSLRTNSQLYLTISDGARISVQNASASFQIVEQVGNGEIALIADEDDRSLLRGCMFAESSEGTVVEGGFFALQP